MPERTCNIHDILPATAAKARDPLVKRWLGHLLNARPDNGQTSRRTPAKRTARAGGTSR